MLKLVGKGQAVERKAKERYLLFDSGCSACTDTARAVEEETEGWLTARSLRDPEVQQVLKKANPNWRFEPTLLEVNGDKTVAFTGIAMKVRMLMGLGPRRAARIYRIARQEGALDLEIAFKPSENDRERQEIESIKRIDRGSFLKSAGALTLGAALLPLLPQGALAQESGPAAGTTKTASAARIQVRRLTATQTAGAFKALGARSTGTKLRDSLRSKGFNPIMSAAVGMLMANTVNVAGGTISATSATLLITIPYKKPASGEVAKIHLSVSGSTVSIANGVASIVGGRIRGDHAVLVGKRLDVYALASGRVALVRRIADIEAERRRLGIRTPSQVSTSSRAAQAAGCSTCLAVAPAVISLGCGVYFSAVSFLVCGAVTAATLSAGALACTLAVGAIYNVLCYLGAPLVTPAAVCGPQGVAAC